MTPHQQSGGLEALIKERTQTFWEKNGNPDSLSSISQFHPDISGLLPQVIDEDRVTSMTLAYEKGRADRDEEIIRLAQSLEIDTDYQGDITDQSLVELYNTKLEAFYYGHNDGLGKLVFQIENPALTPDVTESDYETHHSHRHCWQVETPPCGLKAKHRCCLCGLTEDVTPKP